MKLYGDNLMQFETEKDLRIKQLRLIVVVMLVLFAVIMAYTIYWLIDYKDKYGFFEKTEAVVVDQVTSEGITYDVLNYKVDGVEYNVTSNIKSENQVGDQIKVYYDEKIPLSIIYSLDSRRIILPIIACCFGVVSISLMVVYIIIYLSNKNYKKLLLIMSSQSSDEK